MVIRGSIEGFSLLCARFRTLARGCKFAVALAPACLTLGCQDADHDQIAADHGLADHDRPMVLSEVAISEAKIRFSTGAEQFELVLIPNTRLLARDAVVVRDGVPMSAEQAGIALPYRGYVAGDANSWIRVSVSERGFEGLIYTRDNLWDVRELASGEIAMSHADIGDYLDQVSHNPHTCASADAEAAHATYADDLTAGGQAAPGCKQIDIALVADYSHVGKLGGVKASENEMLKRLNETDGIYRADLNYGFVVKELRTFSKSGGPSFNNSKSGSTPLEQFASYKKSELAKYGLAHLFLGRSSSGTVGKAYIGATCSASKGAGVSNYLGKSKASTVIVAHEIGHNFGAKHDASGAPYIMAPSIKGSATDFSKASKSNINSHVGSVSCFEPCDAGGPKPKPQPDPASCTGACGGKSAAGCWCDSQCTKYGDCCSDYQQVCEAGDDPDASSCTGACGGKSSDGCWCDADCKKYGDCCDDKQQVCG